MSMVPLLAAIDLIPFYVYIRNISMYICEQLYIKTLYTVCVHACMCVYMYAHRCVRGFS